MCGALLVPHGMDLMAVLVYMNTAVQWSNRKKSEIVVNSNPAVENLRAQGTLLIDNDNANYIMQ